jgi:twitching motility protein PilT
VGARLDQVLAYLDREGVTEILLGVGHPVTLLKGGERVAITKVPVTKAQLDLVIEGTPLVSLIPDDDDTTPPIDLTFGQRRVHVRVGRRGDEVVFRIVPAPPVARTRTNAVRIKGATTSPRTKPATQPARTRTATQAARTKTNTQAARSKGATTPPRSRTKSRSIPVTNVKLPTMAMPALDATKLPTMAMPAVAGGTRLVTDRLPKPTATDLAGLVSLAVERGGTDLHVATGRPAMVRVLGDMVPIGDATFDVDALLAPLLTPHRTRFDAAWYIDLAVEGPAGAGRLRANVSRFQGGIRATFRIARAAPPTLEEIGLPRELSKVTMHHQGLVVIAGPSGHGKTTTLAALVELINAARPHHIITVEDPVEIVYPRKQAVVSQREVGSHTKSFAAALKGSLREDPDVIVIGELRDRETVEIALTAAETGHLVLATMSTPSAAKTIDRLIDMFPPADQAQVRSSIAGALRAIVAQRLIPASDGSAMVAAVELLTGCLPLSAMIRDDKLYQLPNLMQRGRILGMIRLDDSLAELVRAGKISSDAALAATENRKELAAALKLAAPAAPVATQPIPRGGLGGLFGKKP